MPQTSVTAPTVGQVGTLASGTAREFKSAFAASAIPVGSVVVYDDGDRSKVELPDDITEISGSRVAGIAMLDPTRVTPDYEAGDMVLLCVIGEVFVTTEVACAPGDPVHVRAVAGGGEVLGAVRPSQDSTDTGLLAGAKFVSTAGNDSTAIVRISLP